MTRIHIQISSLALIRWASAVLGHLGRYGREWKGVGESVLCQHRTLYPVHRRKCGYFMFEIRVTGCARLRKGKFSGRSSLQSFQSYGRPIGEFQKPVLRNTQSYRQIKCPIFPAVHGDTTWPQLNLRRFHGTRPVALGLLPSQPRFRPKRPYLGPLWLNKRTYVLTVDRRFNGPT
jgi:hypothetical protein